MKAAKLTERPTFTLLKQSDVQSFYHMQMPRWLFFDSRYSELSLEAKVTYTFLLNRFQLSKLNGWMNDRGEVFIIFPREALAREMQISYKKAIASFKELVAAKLIWEKRCGRGDANQIYLAQVDADASNANYESAPFVSEQCSNGHSKHAGSAGLEAVDTACIPAAENIHTLTCSEIAPQEVPFSRICSGGFGTFKPADFAGADLPKTHTSNTNRSFIKQNNIEVSQSVMPAQNKHEDNFAELSGILENCELWVFDTATACVFENAIERLFYADSFRVGNATLPQARVRAKLHQLDSLVLQSARNKLHDNRKMDVKNSTTYTMSVIFNAIAESESDLMVDPYLNSLRRPPTPHEGR